MLQGLKTVDDVAALNVAQLQTKVASLSTEDAEAVLA